MLVKKRSFAIWTFTLFLLVQLNNTRAQSNIYPSEITVSKDGAGNYQTIQEAVNSIRDLGEKEVKIIIKKGIYREKLIIPSWKTKIKLIGESNENTIISFGDFSGKKNATGQDAFGTIKFSTYTSFTLLVAGDDITLENLTIVNDAGSVGQAVALHVEGDRFVAKNCAILGHQDTLYGASESSRQLYTNCYIEGTTDFIFGKATMVFKNCLIKSLSNSYITAAATSSRQKFGFVFFNCTLIADSSVTKVYLGRPWRPYAKTVFINCELGKHIAPEGWNPWKGDAMFLDKDRTAYYAEYQSKGLGASAKKRVPWSKQLTARQARVYTVQNILKGLDDWKP
ncbi:pectin esterase [Pedobacter yonginense]|uniref:Pectinesterase n=1 Tax=Pedobacter yonginense TaxID=651869 RepID=A0A317EM61_9SPHI|nr:pectinesterase family protein [Pedobacter yonginense]PWS27694.1 pectin esterase [Pedobacter yonginense]